MDWDDLKVLLALGRKGSARGAAQLLGVSNSTITRRLDDMELELHTRLFDRTPDGYHLTEAGAQLLPTAEHVEDLVLAAERQVTGGDQELTGNIRLTLPPGGMAPLFEHLAGFAARYPGIDLELVSSAEPMDLSRREADIAIRVLRVGKPPPEYLIGRRLGQLTASTYVHRELLRAEDPADVSHLTWIGKSPGRMREEWLAQGIYPDSPVRHAIDDFSMTLEALRWRMGMALLPCFAAFRDPDVVRVPGSPIVHHSDVWVLTHKDLRPSARLRVLREMIYDAFQVDRVQQGMDSRLR